MMLMWMRFNEEKVRDVLNAPVNACYLKIDELLAKDGIFSEARGAYLATEEKGFYPFGMLRCRLTDTEWFMKVIEEWYIMDDVNDIEHLEDYNCLLDDDMTLEKKVDLCNLPSKEFIQWLNNRTPSLEEQQEKNPNVPKTFDMLPFIKQPYEEKIKELNFNYPFLVDVNDEYKLYKNQDESYTLFDDFDNGIGSTECDNIEDALEELQNQNELSV